MLICALGTGCAGEKANGRPWIHDIRFVGLHNVSKSDLKKKISIQKTSWLPWSPRTYLDPFAIPGDRVRIEAYYRANGYFAAKVTKADTIQRKSKKPSVDVVFHIEEGQPVKISAVDVKGLEATGKERKRVERMLPLRPGQVFVHEGYLGEKTLVEHRLKLHGFAWPQVTGEVGVDRDARTAVVEINAVPGPLAHIGTITAEGFKQTRAIDIVRTADLTTGRKFSPVEIDVARGRVYNVGVYSSVRLKYEHDPQDPSIANVRIQVQEAQFHELRLGGGVTIESQRNDVHLLGQYTKRNFLGGMRVLQLRLVPAFVVVPAIWYLSQAGTRYGPAVAAEATFRQPFLFGVRHLDLHWTVGYDLDIDYAFQYHGPRTSLGINYSLWRDRVRFGLSYNIQYLDFFNTDSSIFSASDASQAGSVYGYLDPYRVAWVQESASLDLRNRPREPHQGAYFAATAEQGGIYTGSAFTYEKVIPEARFYIPLGSRLTGAARIQYGHVWVQGDVGSPITRRLYLGGPDSHRGFNFNRLSYQVPSGCPAALAAAHACPKRASFQAIPIGGDESLLLQAELRLNIVKLAGNWLGIVGFADGGDVGAPQGAKGGDAPPALTGARSRIDITNLHWAVGGGLRYATVIGTIRFDLGFRINRLDPCTNGAYADANAHQCGTGGTPNPDPGRRVAFHLSVGEAF